MAETDTYNGSVELGAHLRHRRKRQGLGQKEAAALVGVSQSQWSRWEDAKLMPDPRKDFAKLAEFLGVDEAEVVRLAFGIKDQSTVARLDALEDQLAEVRRLLRDISQGGDVAL